MDRTKIFACLIAAALSSGCSTRNIIVVGSKNFTEQLVLGEIVAQHIEQKLHTQVERKLDLGGTLLTQRALTSGQIDLYPEYTGTAYTNVLKHQSIGDPAAVLKTVQAEYESRFHLRWLAPLGFNDSFAMVIRGEDARARHLKTLSDAAGYARGWTLGAGYEFLGRPDGYKSLMKTYPGLRWTGSPKSMDLGLLYQALKQKQVSMAAGNTTDGVLSALDVVVLEDDRHAFPPYQASIVVREDALTRFPGLEAALNDLSGKISESTMRRLNYEVDSQHRPVRVVAGEFLTGMDE